MSGILSLVIPLGIRHPRKKITFEAIFSKAIPFEVTFLKALKLETHRSVLTETWPLAREIYKL